MGLFGKSKPKTLFSLLKMRSEDIYSLNYEKISEEPNQQGKTIITYRAKLNQIEFNVFDAIEVVCWTLNPDLKNQPFNVFFKIWTGALTIGNVRDVTNLLASTFGPDSSGEKHWNDYDLDSVNQKLWTGRLWHFDELGNNKGDVLEGSAGYDLMLNYDEEGGFSLNVLGFDHLIKIND
jgi:hypothetical protein